MEELTYKRLRVREHGSTCFVQLHRPDAGNAIDDAMVRELNGVLTRAAGSETTVVVIEGLPDVFCLGADFAAISSAARQGKAVEFDSEAMFNLFHQMASSDLVTVAHVRGKANAGGVGFVAASDLVIADASAAFSLSELLFGLIPAIVLPFLIRRIGFQRAHYLAATTLTIDAQRAADWGLVDAYGADSYVLLRRHLQRLGRLSKKSISRYKTYVRTLAPITSYVKGVALTTNREVFADPENVRAIQRFSDSGMFPWEGSA